MRLTTRRPAKVVLAGRAIHLTVPRWSVATLGPTEEFALAADSAGARDGA